MLFDCKRWYVCHDNSQLSIFFHDNSKSSRSSSSRPKINHATCTFNEAEPGRRHQNYHKKQRNLCENLYKSNQSNMKILWILYEKLGKTYKQKFCTKTDRAEPWNTQKKRTSGQFFTKMINSVRMVYWFCGKICRKRWNNEGKHKQNSVRIIY